MAKSPNVPKANGFVNLSGVLENPEPLVLLPSSEVAEPPLASVGFR